MNTVATLIRGYLVSLRWGLDRPGQADLLHSDAADRKAAAIHSGTAPTRGLGLGLRLALLTTFVVVGVMAAVSGTLLAWDLRAELRDRQALLGESLKPLAAQLQAARDWDHARAMLLQFHSPFGDAAHRRHYFAISNLSRQVILDAGERSAAAAPSAMRASMVVKAAFRDEPVIVLVEQDSPEYAASRSGRWWAWAVHVAVTAFLMLLFLHVVILREVTGPIQRLLNGVRKMELGYWEDMPDPEGAWEIRWLAWRFRALGSELSRTATHLIAAHRRAYAESGGASARAAPLIAAEVPLAPGEQDDAAEAVCALQALLCRLQDPAAAQVEKRSLARLAWDQFAIRAERLGRPDLRVELEDAALQLLDPDGFDVIDRQLRARRAEIDARANARVTSIRQNMAARGIPLLHINYRIKHVAGIWNKMREKNLTFEQVHDVLALRIIVPAESDCYHTLGVSHDLFEPVVGRFKDYVASPKANGYRGLHSSVRDPEGAVVEIQIRSAAMHQFAEQGLAAHADYKDLNRISVPEHGNPRKSALVRLS